MAGSSPGQSMTATAGIKPQPGIMLPPSPAGNIKNMGAPQPSPASGGKGGGVQAPPSMALPPRFDMQPIRDRIEAIQPPKPSIYQQAATGIGRAMDTTTGELSFQPSAIQGMGYRAQNVRPDVGPYAGDINAPRVGYAGDVRSRTAPYAGDVAAPTAGYAGDVTGMGYTARDVSAPTIGYAGDVTGMGYSAPSIAQNIGQFINPFEQQVVSGALGDIERQRQMTANQLASQFGAAKAFGGSRQAIQEAELAKSALEQGASTAASLRQQGFGQALQAAGQQAQMGARASEFGLGQGLQAQLANQAARQRFGEFGAQQDVQTQLANQAAQARAAEFGAGQSIQAQLANQAARQRFGEFGSQQGMQAALANQAARQRFGEFAGGQSIQAQLANQAAQARAREFGLGQSMQAQLANQAAGLSGSQQRMGAASQLANLANLGFGMGQTVQQQMLLLLMLKVKNFPLVLPKEE